MFNGSNEDEHFIVGQSCMPMNSCLNCEKKYQLYKKHKELYFNDDK